MERERQNIYEKPRLAAGWFCFGFASWFISMHKSTNAISLISDFPASTFLTGERGQTAWNHQEFHAFYFASHSHSKSITMTASVVHL